MALRLSWTRLLRKFQKTKLYIATQSYFILPKCLFFKQQIKSLKIRVASAQFPEALNSSTSPETPRTSGLDRSQFRKHVDISDLMGVNSGNTSDLRTWLPPSPKVRRVSGIDSHQVRNSDVFSELTPIKSENTSEFRNSGCKKSKFRIISLFRLLLRSTKLFRP